MTDLVWALHTVSGAVARVPLHLLDHPVFGEYLVEVEPNTKSYDPQLWKPTTAGQYAASRKPSKAKPINEPNSEHEE